MPVKGLLGFCEKIPGIVVEVNLKELIKQELSKTGERPKIVIDASSLSYHFNSEQSSCPLTQPAAAKLRIESFFEEIISNGANVIVVLRGNMVKSPDEWFCKRKSSLKITRELCNTQEEPEKLYYYFTKSATNFCCNETMSLFSNEHYTAFNSVTRTVNEVAKIAVKEKCLAVLGQDSNYLIYEGIRFFISIEGLDIETFSCRFYNRNELPKYLGLKSHQLPMFATLCGNEIVPYYLLQDFQKKISFGNVSTPLCVAEKIKYTFNEPYGCVGKIVKLIAHKKVTENVIRKSLDMYLKFEETQPVDELLKFASERLRKCDWSHKLYRVFVNKEFYGPGLTGFYNDDLTTFELLRPLRKSLYGILHPFDDVRIKEYFLEEMLLHNYTRAIPENISCKISNLENPGVIELFQNRTPRMDILRWELFLSCVNKTLRFTDLTMVPKNCLFSILALHYLYVTVPACFPEKKVFKEAFELEAFLLGTLLFKEFPKDRLENIEESKPDPWELQLHTLYIDVCFILILLNQACGFVIPKQKACVCNFYDGKLTHWIYSKMKKGATCDEFLENDIALETLFDTFMDIIIKHD